jgi:transcriptional regulator with XRE-family HTH domain
MSTQEFRVYNAQSLGAAVRHFRQEAGLTQAELAQRVGVHRSYLSDLERGQVTEQVERLVKVLQSVGARITVAPADW